MAISTQATSCTHPVSRIFAWFANGVLCAGCCDCGEVLAGAAEPWRQITGADDDGIGPGDTVLEARFVSGHVISSAYWDGFGPCARATDNEGIALDTICIEGANVDEEIARGKEKAVDMLRDLIIYEQEG